MPSVFVSSTCYDLIDLRAELGAMIRSFGLDPVMSDDPESRFSVSSRSSSVAICLENVEAADLVIGVLSSRYGPTLERFGVAGVSATHLELRHARGSGKTVLLYVREQLARAFAMGMRAPQRDRWFPSRRDQMGLLGLLAELCPKAPSPNWYWPFKSSVNLKASLRRELGKLAVETSLGVYDHVVLPKLYLAVDRVEMSGEEFRARGRLYCVEGHALDLVGSSDVPPVALFAVAGCLGDGWPVDEPLVVTNAVGELTLFYRLSSGLRVKETIRIALRRVGEAIQPRGMMGSVRSVVADGD